MNVKLQNKVSRQIMNYTMLIAGSIVAAFALEQILIPALIMDGGMVGIAMIVSTKTPIPLSVMTLALNLPLVFIGGKKLKHSFVFRSLTAMAVFFAALTFFGSTKYHVTDDKLLATVFGGMLLGFGV